MPFVADAITARPGRAPRCRPLTSVCALNVAVRACWASTPGPSCNAPPAMRTFGRSPTGHCQPAPSRAPSKSSRTGAGLAAGCAAAPTTGQPSTSNASGAIRSRRFAGSPRA